MIIGNYATQLKRSFVNIYLLVSFALLPFFNDFPLFSFSSTLKSPTSLFILLSVIGFILSLNKEVRFNASIKFGLVLLCAIYVSATFNYIDASSLTSAEISGGKQLIKSYGLMIFLVYSFCWISSVVNTQERLEACIRGIIIGCIISLAVGALEYFSYGLSQGWAVAANNIVEPLIHVRPQDAGRFRLRSTAFEPSYYGQYLAFVFPFIVYLAFFEKKYSYWILLILTLSALWLSKSRTGQISVGIEFILFLLLSLKFKLSIGKGYLKKIVIIVLSLGIISLGIVSASSTRNLDESGSNLTRFSSQVAAYNLFRDHPIMGVGIGLAGAYLPDYYPDYAWYSWEIISWAAPAREKSLSSPVFAMIPRMLAETGLIGVGALIILNAFILVNLRNICISKNQSLKWKAFSLTIGISIVGQFVASFGIDTYAIFGYWFSLGLGAGLISICKNKNKMILPCKGNPPKTQYQEAI